MGRVRQASTSTSRAASTSPRAASASESLTAPSPVAGARPAKKGSTRSGGRSTGISPSARSRRSGRPGQPARRSRNASASAQVPRRARSSCHSTMSSATSPSRAAAARASAQRPARSSGMARSSPGAAATGSGMAAARAGTAAASGRASGRTEASGAVPPAVMGTPRATARAAEKRRMGVAPSVWSERMAPTHGPRWLPRGEPEPDGGRTAGPGRARGATSEDSSLRLRLASSGGSPSLRGTLTIP